MGLNPAQIDQLLRDVGNGTLAGNSQLWQKVVRGKEAGDREMSNLYDEIMQAGGPNSGQDVNKVI